MNADHSDLNYSFENVGEKTFKNGVIDRHYHGQFYQESNLDGHCMTSIHQKLEKMFDDVTEQAKQV